MIKLVPAQAGKRRIIDTFKPMDMPLRFAITRQRKGLYAVDVYALTLRRVDFELIAATTKKEALKKLQRLYPTAKPKK